MVDTTLTSIFVTSGVNEHGVGFCTVAAHGTGDTILVGQLDPDVVRKTAMDWLGAAEAAEQDAAVLRCIRKLELPEELAGAIVTELRENRES